MLHIDQLCKSFGTQPAVRGLSLHIPQGSLFGLLGPNGAGKTTTLRCVAGLLRPDAGSLRVAGLDPLTSAREVRRLLGMVPQELALYDELSVLQNLQLFGGLHGLAGRNLQQGVEQALELAQLGARRKSRAGQLSGGMRRRLNLACSLVHQPRLLICDEPTVGVDPQSRQHLFETIRRLHREGMTIVYTTHYMEEVEALCEQVAIIDHGRLVVVDSLAGVLGQTQASASFTLELAEPTSSEALRAALEDAGIASTALRPTARSLEDVFLELTGHSLRDGS